MKNLKLFIVIITIFSLYSCSPQYYIPHGAISPDLKEKGDVYVEGKISSSNDIIALDENATSYIGAIGYAITDNLGTYVKASKGKRFSTSSFFQDNLVSIEDNIKDLEFGIGKMGRFGSHGVYDYYFINQLGATDHRIKRNAHEDLVSGVISSNNYSKTREIHTNFWYAGLQSKFGVEFPKFSLSLNNKLGRLNYFNINDTSPNDTNANYFSRLNIDNSNIVFGQDVKISFGSDLKIFLQGGYSYAADTYANNDDLFLSAGASYRFNPRK